MNEIPRVDRQMVQRDVPSGLIRPDKSWRVVRIQLDQIEQLRDHPPETWPSPEALPVSLMHLAEALEELTWHDLARLAYLEMLALYRELDTAKPGAFVEGFRRTLTSLRGNYFKLGHYEEALQTAQEERQLCLRLIGTEPYAQQMANDARHWITRLLTELGRHEEAAESAGAGLAEVREQPPSRHGTPKPVAIAHASSRYADCLARVDRIEEAVEAIAEAAEYWRVKPQSHPSQYAETLEQLGKLLARAGRYEDARTVFLEPVEEIRQWAEQDKYELRTFCAVLNNTANSLRSLGLHREALTVGEEAVTRYRELVELQPVWQEARNARRKSQPYYTEPDWDEEEEEQKELQAAIRKSELTLCIALVNLGNIRHTVGMLDEALAANAEGVAIERTYSDASAQLAMALNNRAAILDDMARYEEALTAATEAVALSTRHAADDPKHYESSLARARNTFSVSASVLGRHDDALAASLAALDTYRRLHKSNPHKYAALLADALTDHGLVRSRRGEHAKALAATTGSVALYRQLADRNPPRYGPVCAQALVAFAEVRLTAGESLVDGRAAAAESVTRYEPLATALPEAYARRLEKARAVLDHLS